MLLRFAVTNHLSIRESQELSFAASSLQDRRDGLIDCKAVSSRPVLPAIVIYGANASGKSNILNAIATMKKLVLWSHIKGEPGEGIPRNAFKLDPACLPAPSKFEIDFIIDDVRHHYGFEATDKVFTGEWLYTYPLSQPRKLFERNKSTFSFGRELKGQNKSIAGLTRPNSLFLSAAAQNGHKQLSKIYKYFDSISISGANASARVVRDEFDSRVIEFLTSIDTGVTGYREKKIEIPEEAHAIRKELKAVFEKLSGDPIRIKPEEEEGKYIAIELAHSNRKGEPVYFDLDSESAGTRRLLIVLSPYIS